MIIRPPKNIVSPRGRFLIGLFLLLITIPFDVPRASAADYPKLPNRSLSLDDASPGATTRYTMSWQWPSAATVGSIRLEMCHTGFTDDACINPAADMSAATLFSQAGNTGFSILSQTAGEIVLTRAPGAVNTSQSTYVFDDIDNPAGLQAKFFVRITTYPTADASGPLDHMSSIVSATTAPIVITSEVPPILYFCAALTITDWCASANGNFIDYGNLSSVVANASISQFGVATNAAGGYVVTINGNTMTAGLNSIPALTLPAASIPGTGQFGLNLRANTNPPNGQDPFGSGIGTIAAAYAVPDSFLYNDGDAVASAVTGSLFNTFTVTYVVNIPPAQAAGVYNTTIAYICTAAF